MFFFLGFIAGLLIALLVLELLPYFARPLAARLDKKVQQSLPRGEIIRTKTRKEIAVEKYLLENEKDGGVPLSDLL